MHELANYHLWPQGSFLLGSENRTMWIHYVCSVYRGGYMSAVHRRDTMSTSGGYHEYIGECSVHWGMSWCMWGNTISTSEISWVYQGDVMSTRGGDVQYIRAFNRIWKVSTNLLSHMHHDILRCTEHPPMYSWCPRCTHGIPPMYSWYLPMYSWYPLDVLMIPADILNNPRCTHDIPRCTHDIPRCTHGIPRRTEHPLMYWTHIIQGD